ncbi:hypothetical protein AM571_CH00584 [Rhizobium etli 8C-3]|uniref:Uncharacterized protein n=1 Tax=Rhizobium etli 8C-3 TaxID=538025 RepID=A0A1L5NZV2_RHIET|nr:hypothetical protein AM571_CH00584 [Rhizobium etli 8C-3]
MKDDHRRRIAEPGPVIFEEEMIGIGKKFRCSAPLKSATKCFHEAGAGPVVWSHYFEDTDL